MSQPDRQWVAILEYENLPKRPAPQAALRSWARGHGIDWMPFSPEDVRVDLICGRGDDGHWRGWYRIQVDATVLRRLRLHPDQS